MELEEILDDLLPPDLCLSCIYRRFYPTQSPCFKCIEFGDCKEDPTGEFYKKIKITNYDRLISKSPEELAKWIARQTTGAGRIVPDEEYRFWLGWLKQEVEE